MLKWWSVGGANLMLMYVNLTSHHLHPPSAKMSWRVSPQTSTNSTSSSYFSPSIQPFAGVLLQLSAHSIRLTFARHPSGWVSRSLVALDNPGMSWTLPINSSGHGRDPSCPAAGRSRSRRRCGATGPVGRSDAVFERPWFATKRVNGRTCGMGQEQSRGSGSNPVVLLICGFSLYVFT